MKNTDKIGVFFKDLNNTFIGHFGKRERIEHIILFPELKGRSHFGKCGQTKVFWNLENYLDHRLF